MFNGSFILHSTSQTQILTSTLSLQQDVHDTNHHHGRSYVVVPNHIQIQRYVQGFGVRVCAFYFHRWFNGNCILALLTIVFEYSIAMHFGSKLRVNTTNTASKIRRSVRELRTESCVRTGWNRSCPIDTIPHDQCMTIQIRTITTKRFRTFSLYSPSWMSYSVRTRHVPCTRNDIVTTWIWTLFDATFFLVLISVPPLSCRVYTQSQQ